MKCSKCGAELKQGAKFCVKCGTPVAQSKNSIATCPECGAELKPNAKFCTKCGAKITTEKPESSETMTSVKRHVFWNVQPGELARRVNESEFENYDSATGIIVNESTTAYIRVNGQLVTVLNGGMYEFVNETELENHIHNSENHREGGVAGTIRRGFRWVVNAVFGHKANENEEANNPDRQNSVDAVVRCMNSNNIVSLLLRLDKDFELVFGDSHSSTDEYSNYIPMQVRTKLFDMNVGVRAFFRITNFDEFVKYYLGDRNMVSTAMIAEIISPVIQASVQEIMQDVELRDNVIPDVMKQQIVAAITRNANASMHGIELVNVVEITASNDDLDRFRTLSRELYVSEQELDYLVRTDDFKNRLNMHVDEQELYDARRVVEKEQKLNDINKDGLLNKDEFDKFTEVLELERRIRQAHNQEQIDVVENEIASNRLTREYTMFKLQRQYETENEDFELGRDRQRRMYSAETDIKEQELKEDYADRRHARDIKNQELDDDYEARKFEKEYGMREKEQDIHMRGERLEYGLDKEKKEDTYNFDKRKADDDADRDMKVADSALDRLAKIKEMERMQAQMDQQHELDMQHAKGEADVSKINAQKDMSAEAIMAMGAAGLDAAAQAEFARSFSEKANADKEKELAQKMEELYAAAQSRDANDKAQWMEMMKAMMQQNTSVMESMAGMKDKQNAEIRDRLREEEQRMDSNNETAMHYITKNNVPPTQPTGKKQCPNCGSWVDYDDPFCENCGHKFEQ